MYENMKDRVEALNKILKTIGAEFTIKYDIISKTDDDVEGYVLVAPNVNCSPIIYRGAWYEQADEYVASTLIQEYNKSKCAVDVDTIMTKDYILANIFPKLVGEENKERLVENNRVFIPFLNLYIAFYIKVDNLINDDLTAAINVTEKLLKELDVTVNEAEKCAIENMEKEITVNSLAEVVAKMMGEDFEELDVPNVPDMQYVCTNERKRQGAASLLCDSTRAKLHEKMGKKIIILPSSVHEIIAAPYQSDNDFKMFREMVKDVNETQVAPEDRLSDSVYILENGTLSIAI